MPSGFTTAAANSSESLDYVKAPLFDFALGRALPPSGSANADDLQDLLTLYLDHCKAAGGDCTHSAQNSTGTCTSRSTPSSETPTACTAYDIHMNQGNVGDYAGDNGPFHDGGVLLSFPDRVMGLFLAFQTQRVPTSAAGSAAPGAQPLSQIVSGQPHPPATVTAEVYLERALINPAGSDPGSEAIVLGNCATTTQSVHGWQLVDRNGHVTKLDSEIPAGASAIVSLDRSGVQLGNNGGNLVLQDDQSNQVDSVTYSAADAAVVDRYVRFQR